MLFNQSIFDNLALQRDSGVNQGAAVSMGLMLLDRYDKDASFRNNLGKQSVSDSASLPEGALTQYMPPLMDIHAGNFWTEYIPMNPLKAPGVDKLVYPRVKYHGTMIPTQKEAEDGKGKLDIGLENIELKVQRYDGYFEINDYEADQMNYMLSRRDFVGTINLLQEKRQSVVYAWLAQRDKILCQGVPSLGLFGFLSHPDIEKVNLSDSLDASNTADQNIAALAQAAQRISTATEGIFKPTTLVLPTGTLESLGMQRLGTSPSDKSVLSWFQDNRRSVFFDGGRGGSFEITESPRLENFESGFNAAVMFCRKLDCVEQVLPKDLTYSQPIPKKGGYEIYVHGEIAGLALKRGASAVRIVWPR